MWKPVQHLWHFFVNGAPRTSRRQKKVCHYPTRHSVTPFAHTSCCWQRRVGGSVWLVLHAASGSTGRRYQRKKEFGGGAGVPLHECLALCLIMHHYTGVVIMCSSSFLSHDCFFHVVVILCHYQPCIRTGRRKWSWQQQLRWIHFFGAFCGC